MLKIGNDEYRVEDVLAIHFKDGKINLIDYNHDLHVYTKQDEPNIERKLSYCKSKLHKNMFIINNELLIRLIRIHSIVKSGTTDILIRYGYREHEEYRITFENEEKRNSAYSYFNFQLKKFYKNANQEEGSAQEITETEFIMGHL